MEWLELLCERLTRLEECAGIRASVIPILASLGPACLFRYAVP
jgi:hypothetical protein